MVKLSNGDWKTSIPIGAIAHVSGAQNASSSISETAALSDLKQQFRQSAQNTDRGIFGVQAAKRQEIAAIVEQLEALNPLQQPTQHLDKGVKKTKLGLREFVRLGAFLNVIQFSVAGLGMLSGSLTVKASYEVVSDQRVAIKFMESTLVPEQLQQIFQQNYDLLLSVFNPEGWLDITFVDEELRVGRDDKGNIYILERCAQ
eukprot:gene4379-4632_t